jgi:hypothetical protein
MFHVKNANANVRKYIRVCVCISHSLFHFLSPPSITISNISTITISFSSITSKFKFKGMTGHALPTKTVVNDSLLRRQGRAVILCLAALNDVDVILLHLL